MRVAWVVLLLLPLSGCLGHEKEDVTFLVEATPWVAGQTWRMSIETQYESTRFDGEDTFVSGGSHTSILETMVWNTTLWPGHVLAQQLWFDDERSDPSKMDVALALGSEATQSVDVFALLGGGIEYNLTAEYGAPFPILAFPLQSRGNWTEYRDDDGLVTLLESRVVGLDERKLGDARIAGVVIKTSIQVGFTPERRDAAIEEWGRAGIDVQRWEELAQYEMESFYSTKHGIVAWSHITGGGTNLVHGDEDGQPYVSEVHFTVDETHALTDFVPGSGIERPPSELFFSTPVNHPTSSPTYIGIARVSGPWSWMNVAEEPTVHYRVQAGRPVDENWTVIWELMDFAGAVLQRGSAEDFYVTYDTPGFYAVRLWIYDDNRLLGWRVLPQRATLDVEVTVDCGTATQSSAGIGGCPSTTFQVPGEAEKIRVLAYFGGTYYQGQSLTVTDASGTVHAGGPAGGSAWGYESNPYGAEDAPGTWVAQASIEYGVEAEVRYHLYVSIYDDHESDHWFDAPAP